MNQHEIIPGSYLDVLQKRLQPAYVGWIDQYRSILYTLEINPDAPFKPIKL